MRAVDDLTGPLMAEHVEYGDTECYVMQVMIQESPFDAAAMELTAYVIEEANGEFLWKMLEQGLKEKKDIMLLFPSRVHICNPKHYIMVIQQCHETYVVEELGACLLLPVVSSSET